MLAESLPPNPVLAGDNHSGKTSLIAKMQGSDTTCKGSGLEYHYLMVRDEYRDEQTQCGVWILDGDYQCKSKLLKFALNEANLEDTTVLLVCSMTKPWDILLSLQQWISVLENHIKSLKINSKTFEEIQKQSKVAYMTCLPHLPSRQTVADSKTTFRPATR